MPEHHHPSRRTLLRRAVGAAGILLTAPLLAACQSLRARDDQRHAVVMTNDFHYDPAAITIALGNTVVWENQSTNRHSVTTDATRLDQGPSPGVPEGATSWDSGPIDYAQWWEHTFTHPGTYLYVCRYHGGRGMVGTVTVALDDEEASAD